MRVILRTVLLTVVLAATPAMGGTTINLTGSSASDGPDGNIRSFTAGGINVQAMAYSYDGTTLENGWLGQFSSGLGVTNNDEGNGTSGNSHTVDNLGQNDFVAFVFDRAVNISSAVLNPFSVSGNVLDNDAWVSFGTLNGAYNGGTPMAIPLGSPIWSTLNTNPNAKNVVGNLGSGYSTSLNMTGYGNVWIIGASRAGYNFVDNRVDGFKIGSLSVTAAVPEPATWAMMIVGFGMVGAAMRRRARTSVSFA